MATIETSVLERLRDSYGSASWALWSETFPNDGCIEEDPEALDRFIQDRRDALTPEVVLLSLNPSGEFPVGFTNFHSTDTQHYDRRLKEFIQDEELERLTGAYMTDLVMDEVTPTSDKIRPTPSHIARFREQLDLLNQPSYDVLCFHKKPFRALRDYFDAEETTLDHDIRSFETDWDRLSLQCYRVWFYGNWGANRDKVPELRDQLAYLNDEQLAARDKHLG